MGFSMSVNLQDTQIQTSYSDPFRPHDHQLRLLASDSRYQAMIAGTGGGKTWFGPVWLLEEIKRNESGHKYMHIAPTYKMLNWNSLPQLLDYLRFRNVPFEHKKQDAMVEIGWGDTILLGSADRPDSLQGPHCKAIWADEPGRMKRKAWQVMTQRVGQLEGRILLTTTPYSQNWLYVDFYKRWEDGDKNYFVEQFKSIENPYFPEEEYERAKNTLDPDTFAMLYQGLFRKSVGLVYKEFTHDMLVEPFKIPEDWRLVAGIDWGFNDPFVFTLWAKSPTDVCFNCDEYYARGKRLSDHAYEVMKLVSKYSDNKSIYVYYDPEDPQAATDFKEELERLGCDNLLLRPAKRSGKEWVNDGIRYVKSLMWQGKYKVFNTCEKNIEEKKYYHWLPRKDGVDYQDKPAKGNDHVQSAERYCLYTDRKQKLQFYVF